MTPGEIRFVIVDKALPLTESAAAGVDRHAMSVGQLLGALLVTQLEAQGNPAAAAMVRAAMALADSRGQA